MKRSILMKADAGRPAASGVPPRAQRLWLTLTCCALACVACSSAHTPPSTPTTSDREFVADMLVHHQRALQLGALAAQRGNDPRVRAFGRRIVREQTPEAHELQGWVTKLGLRLDSAKSRRMAAGYVSDTDYDGLTRLHGVSFDRRVILLSASSELGAVTMAEEELAGGRYGPARDLATSIDGAKSSEIPELRQLAASL